MGVHRAFIPVVIGMPYHPDDLLAREHLVGVGGEVVEQFKFLRGGADPLPLKEDRAPGCADV